LSPSGFGYEKKKESRPSCLEIEERKKGRGKRERAIVSSTTTCEWP